VPPNGRCIIAASRAAGTKYRIDKTTRSCVIRQKHKVVVQRQHQRRESRRANGVGGRGGNKSRLDATAAETAL